MYGSLFLSECAPENRPMRVPADYDGDGEADFAVWWPTTRPGAVQRVEEIRGMALAESVDIVTRAIPSPFSETSRNASSRERLDPISTSLSGFSRSLSSATQQCS